MATRETNEVGELPSKIPELARSAVNYKKSQYLKVPNNISEPHKKTKAVGNQKTCLWSKFQQIYNTMQAK